MQFWLKMDSGPVEVKGDQIELLRQQGKIPDGKRVISVDGGQEWLTYAEVLQVFKSQPKPKKPKIRKVYSQCVECDATLEDTSDRIGKTDTCPSCGQTYIIQEGDSRSKLQLYIIIGAVVLGIAIACFLIFGGAVDI